MTNLAQNLSNEFVNMVKREEVTYFQKLFIASGKEFTSFFYNLKGDIIHTFMNGTTNSVLMSNCFYTKLCNFAATLNCFLWSFYRKVYIFSDNWVSLFSEDAILSMSGFKFKELVSTLAYHSFYIKDNKNMDNLFSCISSVKYDGFFVSVFNLDFATYISVSPCNKKNKVDKGIVFSVDHRYSVELNLKRNLDILIQEKNKVVQSLNLTQELTSSFVKFIQYIFYLSVANSTRHGEIEYRSAEKFFNVSEDKDSITCFLEDVKEGKEISIVNVETPSISYNSVLHSLGVLKCTHTRRGHYHRYWVGHGEKKKLVERWVDATVINEGKNTLSKLVHKVT